MEKGSMFQTRSTALQGEYVRLYCTFERDGRLQDPIVPPMVRVVTAAYDQESSSSSDVSESSATSHTSSASESSGGSSQSSTEHVSGKGWGPFYAKKEHNGIWYLDWYVPADLVLGDYYDIWNFKWDDSADYEQINLKFSVHARDVFLNTVAKALSIRTSDTTVEMMLALQNNLILEVQRIPVHWEQGYRGGPRSLNFAFGNWIPDPHPQLRRNKRLMTSGWTPDMNGHIDLESGMDPEDNFYAQYHFRYFSDEDLISFLNEGLFAMNATPPASMSFGSLPSSPFAWRFGITLYASMQALRRLLMGLTVQERAIIFGERPEDLQRAQSIWEKLYQDYSTMWMEFRKDIKTNRLPGIQMIVTPEYTLPGGRSRWFRYLYSSNI